MKAGASLIEPLLERAELYSKSSFELLKLKSLDKAADVISAGNNVLAGSIMNFFKKNDQRKIGNS